MWKWILGAIAFYIHAGFEIYKGIDRVESYSYDETYEELNKYAYVGGDAYNYIINSNILTGHFMLAGSSIVAGAIIQTIKKSNEKKEIPMTVTAQKEELNA